MIMSWLWNSMTLKLAKYVCFYDDWGDLGSHLTNLFKSTRLCSNFLNQGEDFDHKTRNPLCN